MLNFMRTGARSLALLAAMGMGGMLSAEEDGTAVELRNLVPGRFRVVFERSDHADPGFDKFGFAAKGERIWPLSFTDETRDDTRKGFILDEGGVIRFSYDFRDHGPRFVEAKHALKFSVASVRGLKRRHYLYTAVRSIAADNRGVTCSGSIVEVAGPREESKRSGAGAGGAGIPASGAGMDLAGKHPVFPFRGL